MSNLLKYTDSVKTFICAYCDVAESLCLKLCRDWGNGKGKWEEGNGKREKGKGRGLICIVGD